MIDLDALETQIEVWQIERETLNALIAELRASRKVVEAARRWRKEGYTFSGGADVNLAQEIDHYEALK